MAHLVENIEVEARDLNKAVKDNVALSCYRVMLRDNINWVTNGIVRREVGSQGSCSVCWAWGATQVTEATFAVAGRPVPPLSVQHVIDMTYPKRPGCCGGHVVAALEEIRSNGVAELQDYLPYTGIKSKGMIRQPSEELHRIDYWGVIQDNETSMITAINNQPFLISIPYVSGIAFFTGEGFIDVTKALKYHDPDLMRGPPTSSGHTVLVTGHGTFNFEPEHEYWRGVRSITYWIIKNQWKKFWGQNGFAYLITTSSLLDIERSQLPRTLTDLDVEEKTYYYSPVIAMVNNGEAFPVQQTKVQTNLSPEQLIDYITNEDRRKLELIFLLYESDFCKTYHPNIKEEFLTLAKTYENDDDVIMAMLDLKRHRNATSLFKLTRRDSVVLLAFKAKKKKRSIEDGFRFIGEKYSLGEFLFWLGDTVDMGRERTV